MTRRQFASWRYRQPSAPNDPICYGVTEYDRVRLSSRAMS